MGMFQGKVRVSNPIERSRYFEENFWVDTGSFYSWIPEDRLKEIGIVPQRTWEYILADGRRDKTLIGEALFTFHSCRIRRPAASSLRLLERCTCWVLQPSKILLLKSIRRTSS